MSEFPVSDQIDDNVTLEFLSELSGELEGSLDILHAVRVDVENGCVDRLSDISRVDSRSGLARVGSETNLVIYNDVDRAADLVVRQRLHLELLENDALSCESRITVDYDRDNSFSVTFLATHCVLLGSYSPHNNRVDRLQVTRISQQ